MADGVTTQSATPATIPTSTKVATDDAGGAGHVQVVKLAVPTDGSASAWGDATAGLPVEITNPGDISGGGGGSSVPTTPVTVQSSGLTTASTAYVAGDQLGALMTFAGMAATSGGSGRIVGATLTDVANVAGHVDLFVFSASVTVAGDNDAGPATSDADTRKCLHYIPLPAMTGLGSNRVTSIGSLSLPYYCSGGTSLYVAMVTRSAHTFFGAATDLELTLYVELD